MISSGLSGEVAMGRSSEVERTVLEMYDAMRKGDGDAAVALIGDGDGVLFVGSDPAEWWQGSGPVSVAFRAQLEASGGFEMVTSGPLGLASGDVGWFADHPALRLADGTEIPMRLTGVVLREGSAWRIVQGHLSIGVSNEDALGQELPT
jgi:ketosteroid isomerase-like protein